MFKVCQRFVDIDFIKGPNDWGGNLCADIMLADKMLVEEYEVIIFVGESNKKVCHESNIGRL